MSPPKLFRFLVAKFFSIIGTSQPEDIDTFGAKTYLSDCHDNVMCSVLMLF